MGGMTLTTILMWKIHCLEEKPSTKEDISRQYDESIEQIKDEYGGREKQREEKFISSNSHN